MKPYIHSAPGRVRIKSKELKLNPRKSNVLKAIYLEQHGVTDATLNLVNSSITVKFDPQSIHQHTILAIASGYLTDINTRLVKPNYPKKLKSAIPVTKAAGVSRDLAARAGHIAIGVLLEKGVRYSMSNILGLR